MNFLVVGNPGVGKSTLLNAMIGMSHFKSGFSAGTGLTFQFDQVKVGSNNYFDTPGLADMKKRDAAAKAIEEALKQNGSYKIMFVIGLNAGRVQPDDVATIQCVMNACPIIGNNYGIVINKVPKNGVSQVQEKIQEICASIFGGSLPPTAFIHVNEKDKDLDDVNDTFKPLTAEFQKFIEVLPSINIAPHDVTQIDTKNYDQIAEAYKEMIQKLYDSNADLSKRFADQQESFRDQIQAMVKSQNEMQKGFLDRDAKRSEEEEARAQRQEQVHRDQMAEQKRMLKEQQDNHAQQMVAMQPKKDGGGDIFSKILDSIPLLGPLIGQVITGGKRPPTPIIMGGPPPIGGAKRPRR